MSFLVNSPPSKVTILCIEDDVDALNCICSLLALRFPAAEILFALEGESGVRIFCEHWPQIVITDISMPLLDGNALALRIRSLKPKTTIIAISAYRDTDGQSAANVFDHYLFKPLDFKELVRKVEESLARAKGISLYRVSHNLEQEH